MNIENCLDDEILEELHKRALSIKDFAPEGLAMELFESVGIKALKRLAQEREILLFEDYDEALEHVFKEDGYYCDISDELKEKIKDQKYIYIGDLGDEGFVDARDISDQLPYEFRRTLGELLGLPASSALDNERILAEIKNRLP